MFKTIGIGAQLGNGKDTVADFLVKELNKTSCLPWVRNAFANKVKEVFEQAFGKNREWIEKWKRLEEPDEGFLLNARQCLIGIGDGFRQMKPTIWIERAFENQNTHQVLSDIRYVNESNFIRDVKGGVTILLWRKGYTNDLPNASEQDLVPFVKKCLYLNVEGKLHKNVEVPFDYFIRNEGSLEELYNKIKNLIIPDLMDRWFGTFRTSVNCGEMGDEIYFKTKLLPQKF